MQRIKTAPLAFAVLLTSVLLAANPALAFLPRIHKDIMKRAIGDKVSDKVLKIMNEANVWQDKWYGEGGFWVETHHFDNNTLKESFDYVNSEFKTAISLAYDADTNIEHRDAALQCMGRLYHTIQDFYAHSNYVELSAKNHTEVVSIFHPSTKSPSFSLPAGIKTTYFYGPTLTYVEPINFRSTNVEGMRKAYNIHFLDNNEYAALKPDTYEGALRYATGAYPTLHEDMNKDDPGTREGRIGVPSSGGRTFYSMADLGAIRETISIWKLFTQEITDRYGQRAPVIIDALTGKKEPKPVEAGLGELNVRVTASGDAAFGKVRVVVSSGSEEETAAVTKDAIAYFKIKPGVWNISATAEGFKPAAAHAFVEEGKATFRALWLEPLPKEARAKPPSDKVELKVLVFDGASHLIPNTTIELVGPVRAAATTPTGELTIHGVPFGGYTLNVSATGFAKAQLSVTVDESMISPAGPKEIRIDLKKIVEKKYDFTVSAIDEKGGLVPNTTIEVTGPAAGKSTTPNGQVNFVTFPAGTYTVKGSAKGYSGGQTQIVLGEGMALSAGRGAVSVILRKAPETKVDFTLSVLDKKRNFIPNANVELSGPSAASTVAANGQVNFVSVPTGSYTIKASAKGFVDSQISIAVDSNMPSSGSQKYATITLKRQTKKIDFYVFVVDTHGSPVGGVAVALSGEAQANGVTGESGYLPCAGFPDGNYAVQLSRKGYKTEKQAFTLNEETGITQAGSRVVSFVIEKEAPLATSPQIMQAASSVWDPFVGTWAGWARVTRSNNKNDIGQSFNVSLRVAPYGNTYAIYVGSDVIGNPTGYRVSREGDTLTVTYAGPVIDTNGKVVPKTTVDVTIKLTVRGNAMTGGEWFTLYDQDGTSYMVLSLSLQRK